MISLFSILSAGSQLTANIFLETVSHPVIAGIFCRHVFPITCQTTSRLPLNFQALKFSSKFLTSFLDFPKFALVNLRDLHLLPSLPISNDFLMVSHHSYFL